MAHTQPTIKIIDEGEATEYTAEEYTAEGGRVSMIRCASIDQARLESGTLADEVRHNPHVVERAADEGAFVASIEVPFWFRQDDEEVAETFEGDDRITALVEDYSDGAWRIIGKEQVGFNGEHWFTWAWTFVPKSLATVTRVVGIESEEHAREFNHELFELRYGGDDEDPFESLDADAAAD